MTAKFSCNKVAENENFHNFWLDYPINFKLSTLEVIKDRNICYKFQDVVIISSPIIPIS